MEKMEMCVLFPAKLLEYRTKEGWSQATLAKKIGMDEESVRRWETGKGHPSLYAQRKLCDVFETTHEELGLRENPRLKQIASSSTTDTIPTISTSSNAFSQSKGDVTPTKEGLYRLFNLNSLQPLYRKKWLILSTSSLLFILCLFAFHQQSTQTIPTPLVVAGAGCQQDQCTGKDPSKLGCVPGEILRWYKYIHASNGYAIGRIEQWYSPSCNALWTNVQTIGSVENAIDIHTSVFRTLDNTSESKASYNVQNTHSFMIGFWPNSCYTSSGLITITTTSSSYSDNFIHCYEP